MENQNVRLVIVFIIGVIVGIIAYAVVDNAQDRNALGDNTLSATENVAVIQGDNGVIVYAQKAGNTVAVDQVLFAKPGWVAIHDDMNGAPGRILGAQLFDMGKASGSVDLLRNTVAGTSYFAVLHTDDGNYKNFNFHTDTILTNSDGTPIMMKFNTTQ